MTRFAKQTRLIILTITVVITLDGIAAMVNAGANDNSETIGKLSDIQIQRLLVEAQKAFDTGSQILPTDPTAAQIKFIEAAQKFQLLTDNGYDSGKLYYNLGNAQFKSGQLGLAIASYKRAQQRFGADNEKLTANLSYARSLLKTKIPDKDTGFTTKLAGWCGYFSMRTKLWIVAGAWSVFWAMIIARVFLRKFRWRYVLGCMMFVFLLSAGACIYQWSWTSNECQGVVVGQNVTVRKGNGEGFALKFKETLPEGTEFQVLEQRGKWVLAKLPDGKTGWINSDYTEVIEPR